MKIPVLHAFFLGTMALSLFTSPPTCAQSVFPAARPPDFVPLGVYLSWEKPAAIARIEGWDHWDHVGNLLDRCVENHVNTLWVANLSDADFSRLNAACAARNLRLITTFGGIEGMFTRGAAEAGWTDEHSRQLDQRIARAVEAARDTETLVGWLLADEPTPDDLPFVERARQKFRKADPDRFCVTVTQWHVNEYVPQRTGFPVICTDLYPFFGPDDPNGPHTDEASRHFLRNHAARLLEAIGDKSISAWIMGMCFVEIWGPYTVKDDGHIIALPGSYLHWRSPTPAEIRWQVWESIRSGAKGVFIFQLSPIMHVQDKMAELPPPEVAWKDVLLKEAIDAGPGGLTTPGGAGTPQFDALGGAYAGLAPHDLLIRSWKKTSLPLAEAEAPGRQQVFVNPTNGDHYCVVVNDDFHRDRPIAIHFDTQTREVTDLIRKQALVLREHFTNGTKSGTLQLAAGDGVILRIELDE